MMCELPSNAVLADEFLAQFDGFSIGSNDLTQLTLGLDRDSGLVAMGLAKGKKQHDKRDAERDRDWQRERARLMKTSNRA